VAGADDGQAVGGPDQQPGVPSATKRGRDRLHTLAQGALKHGPKIVIPLSWGAPWITLVISLLVGNTSHASVIAGFALFLLASNLALFLYILVNPTQLKLSLRRLGGAFLATFVAVIAAYMAADYAASHSEVILAGNPVLTAHGPKLDPCYVEPAQSGTLRSVTLTTGEAFYVAVGTLTTIGSGDITARSACRVLTAGELVIGFPMVSLAIAGLAAALFKKLQALV
jgi:hypothetical protein